MATMQEMVDDFLAQQRIAVAGVSRSPDGTANLIYRKLKATGHTVYAINPNAETVEGDPCYPDVRSTPEKPDAVMIVTTPEVTDRIVRDCDVAGIKRVWMHCSLMHGVRSTSDSAVQYCKDHGIAVIPAGCPLMYDQPVDFGHKFMKWWMNMTNKLTV
ncbi:MAG: CoA-binding protein [Anaerolineae bacterium]|nr:CoA-binding protein [Anaerolineae bacterium]